MRVVAVVPATDAPATLERCVAAIRAADEPPDDIVVVSHSRLPGPAAARNEGAARAECDVLVFVDADVVVQGDAFARLRAAFADPGLDAVFGSYDDRPEAPGTVSRFRNLLHHHVHQEGAGPASTFWAGLGAVRREAFEAAGGFDAERYPAASIEDVELGLRLSRSGARIVLDPAIQGTHLKAWTLQTMLRTDLWRRGVPWVVLLLDRKENSRTLNLGWRNRLSAGAALVVTAGVVSRRPRRALAGAGALVALNPSLYVLLARRLGPRAAATSVALHTAHLLAATAALPLGAAQRFRGSKPTLLHRGEGPGRLVLREVEDRDLGVLFEHATDPDAIRMAAFTPPDAADRTSFERRWARLRSDDSTTNRVIEIEGRVVGHIASFNLEGRREITYWIGRADWGRGIATRALQELLQLEAARPLYARAASDNAASIRVLTKCGFLIVGDGRGFAHGRNEETDEVVLRLDA